MQSVFLSPVAMARDVLDQYKLDDIPVDVESLCKHLGIRIRLVDFSSIEKKVDKEISGALQRQGVRYTILINESETDVQARFAIAHELGHYFLHIENDPRQIVASFRWDRSPQETAANKFAVELLMPSTLVQEEYAKLVIPVSDTLAQKFNVSKSAMCNRLDSLGLIYV